MTERGAGEWSVRAEEEDEALSADARHISLLQSPANQSEKRGEDERSEWTTTWTHYRTTALNTHQIKFGSCFFNLSLLPVSEIFSSLSFQAPLKGKLQQFLLYCRCSQGLDHEEIFFFFGPVMWKESCRSGRFLVECCFELPWRCKTLGGKECRKVRRH